MSNELTNKDNPRVLVVCLGNICRSPTAEAVLRQRAASAGVALTVDSAGTYGGHAGATPDARSRAAGERRGYDFSGIHSRQVKASDFVDFDIILAADRSNLADLKALCPAEHQHKIMLLLSFNGDGEQDTKQDAQQEVPDPYYGGEQGFEQVLDLIESACDGLLAQYAK
ncbi:protein-tyrosine-phosphatase [Oceanisphaera profunda]|uniref:protein-tyrosine-phosphatase n=1 Tax=Oceanisphaera profunda TaxID=1416627 RepID=A0A1Y0D8A7_9GAMM|nr:low molecular weight protein-tyrosine-phosphatase [Oceanisphaera profunda]ART83782.1 protein-tyrosine-phosphatase [Oceanisphaera profunda]